MKKPYLRRLALVMGLTVMGLWLLWTCLTLLYSNVQPSGVRKAMAGGYLVWLIVAAFFLRPRKVRMRALAFSGAALTLVFSVTSPSNERQWAPDVAQVAMAEIDGDRMTLQNVRNFRYRSQEDFDERWETREYDLAKLRTLDLFMSYWGPVDYCHTILSFGFEGGEQLAVSVEVRNEVGEAFSTLGGFFKMFELSYIFADERDVVLLRTNHRHEDVYLYRLRASQERMRELLLAYVDFANELALTPEFYDVIDNSCGVNILHRIADIGQTTWSGRNALLNGYWDRLMYKRGAIHQGLPFEELRALSLINEPAQMMGDVPGYSAGIRADLPVAPEPLETGS